jgi:mono/diheme cytochrome c family protein
VRISAEQLPDHIAAHAEEPPPETDLLAFGAHLAQTCKGCHGTELTGGPIPGAPPDWAAATNLTTHPDGLAGWTREQFEAVMRTGRRPNGGYVRAPMTQVVPAGEKMTGTEIDALWTYFQSLPARSAR